MFIRLFGLAILLLGAVTLFSAVANPHPDPAVHWISMTFVAGISFGGWWLFRRNAKPKSPMQTQEGEAEGKASAESVGVAQTLGASDAPPSLSGPATAPAPVSAGENFHQLKKRRLAFEGVKHIAGIPHQTPKSRFNILLGDEGVVFADVKTGQLVHRIGWNLLEGIETEDTKSSRDQAAGNAFLSGAIGSGKVGLGGILAVDLMNEVMSSHPLILKYRTHPKDPMTSVIVFDTFENERIATALISKRSALLAEGKIAFD